MKTLKVLLEGLKYEGMVSIRRHGFGGLQYIGGGKSDNLIEKYGGYKVMGSTVIDNVLVIYVN